MTIRVLSKNIPYLYTQTAALLNNTSLAVKSICLIVFCCYFLSFSESAVLAMSVTPGYFNPPHFWIWTALSHCFLEIHFWEVVVDIFTVVLVGKLIEPLWGALEMMTFFFITNIGVAVLSAFFYYFLYMCTFNTELLFQVHIHGLSGYLAGVSIAVKQIMPDHILARTPIGKITNRNIPLAVFGLTFIMWAIGMVEGSYCTMFGTGLVVSWVYLRFYQVHSNGARGDFADSFAFATLFPNVVQPPVSVFSNTVFSMLVKCRACKKPVRRYDVGAPAGITISLPGAESQDAERRRQIALRALSERLSKTEPAPSQWPSMEEPEQADSPTNLSVETGSVGSVESVTPSPTPGGQTDKAQKSGYPSLAMASLTVSKKHLKFLKQTFMDPISQTFCQDVEIKCCNGSMLYNKLLVGLVFPELRFSAEFQLSIAQVLLLPQFTLQEIFEKFNTYFMEVEDVDENKACLQDIPFDSDSGETIEEIITEFVVEDRVEVDEKIGCEESNISDNLIIESESENIVTSQAAQNKAVKCKCTVCGEVFMHRSSLCRHVKQKHGDAFDEENKSQPNTFENKPNSCKVCSKVFKFKTHLINHENTHSKPYKCGLCSETFADYSKLASHELNNHGELINGFGVSNNLMKCSFCPKVFPARSQLVLHERTHTKEKPFQCSQCHKKFSAKCNLTAHERIHFGESKRYECRHPPCIRKFSHTSERKDHETIHTGDKPYMCPNCGERYRRNANLWRHKKKCLSTEKYVEVDSKMIVEEDTDLIVHDPQNNCTTKYEIVFVDTRSRKSGDDIHQHVVSEQVVVAS